MLTTPLYLISDDQATTTGLVALKKNIDIQGPGQIKMTNGSNAVTGFSTTFTDATPAGMSFWFSFWVKDSANNWYHCFVGSVTNNTSLTISGFGTYGRALIRGGYIGVNNDGVGNIFSGVTGTYDYWILRNWSDGLLSASDGNNSYADNFGTAIGGHSTVIGQTGFASGVFAYVSGIQGTALGRYVRSTGNEAFSGGKGLNVAKSVVSAGQTSFNYSESDGSQITGHGALAANSAILGGINQNIPSNSTRSAIIGGNTIKATSATTDTIFMPRLRIGQGISGALVTGTSTNILTRNVTTGEVEALVTSDLSKINAGINWTNRTTPIDAVWFTSAYGNGTFALISTSSNIITSQDGVVWSGRTAATSATWSGSAYGKGLFVAVATNGAPNQVMTSPDGISWTSRSAAANKGWISVTYGNGLFVAVSNTLSGTTANRIMASYDGISWTGRTSPGNTPWKSITNGNGLFVAVSQSTTGTTANKVMYSRDSITWTYTSSAENNQWNSVCYGNGLFVAVANAGTNRVMTSPNGITWTTAVAAAANAWQSVGYGNGLFVAVSNSGTLNRVMTSADGITWTTRSNSIDNNWLTTIFGNGIWVAASNTGTLNRVMTSGKQYEILNTNNSSWSLGGNSRITSPVNIIATTANTITFQINSLKNTRSGAFTIKNSTLATSSVQQTPPAFQMEGEGWTTGGSKTIKFRIAAVGVSSGTTSPDGSFLFETAVNNGLWSSPLFVGTKNTTIDSRDVFFNNFDNIDFTYNSAVSSTGNTIEMSLGRNGFNFPSNSPQINMFSYNIDSALYSPSVALCGNKGRFGSLAFDNSSTGLVYFEVIGDSLSGGTQGSMKFIDSRTTKNGIEYNASGYVSALHSLTDRQYVTAYTTTYLTAVPTNIKISTVGNGLYIKEGSNATMGVATLTSGTAVVATTKVTATSRIQLTSQSDGGTPGWVRVSTRSAGTSFTITSSSGTDTSVIAWLIIEPA